MIAVTESALLQGDCTQLLKTLSPESVDFVLTDPPYVVDYKDRSGRTIANDLHPKQITDGFRQVSRVLKSDRLCFSFYSWQHIDAFAAAWKTVGLNPVGHIVFNKRYTSGERYVRYSHECAYLLAKGRPPPPAKPISDVMEWHYSGNRRHPTEKSVETLKPIIEVFTKVGDLILDPYAGSGSTLVAAALLNRRYIGIELEPDYCASATRRLDGVRRHLSAALAHA